MEVGELLLWKTKVLLRLEGRCSLMDRELMLWPAGLCSTKTSPGLSRWFCIAGVHRVWFTAVLSSLGEVPNSTPALTLVFVRCPFLHHPLLPGEEHAVSQPAEQDGGVVQLRVLGVALLLSFLCKLPEVYYT